MHHVDAHAARPELERGDPGELGHRGFGGGVRGGAGAGRGDVLGRDDDDRGIDAEREVRGGRAE